MQMKYSKKILAKTVHIQIKYSKKLHAKTAQRGTNIMIELLINV